MINFDKCTNENKAEHNSKCPYSRSSIQNINNRRSVSGKTNALLNLINNQPDIVKY